MTNFKEHISMYFKKKKLNVFLSFLTLALLFSVLTKLSTDYTKTITFAVNAINLPEDKVIVQDSSQVIDITLTTYGFKLISYYFKTPSVDVDFSNLQKNKTHYFWIEKQGLSNVISQFDAKVKIGNITPDTLAFKYDVNLIKKIPVVLNETITFSSGFNLTEKLKLQPDSIKVIGPKALIDTIYEIHTKRLVIEDVNKNIRTKIQLNLPEANDGLSFSDSEVILNGDVEKFTEGTVDVPVIIKNVPKSTKIKLYPKTIPVVFYTSLNNYKSISANSFKIECDFNELKPNVTYLTPKITEKPNRVKNVKLNVKRLEFILVQ